MKSFYLFLCFGFLYLLGTLYHAYANGLLLMIIYILSFILGWLSINLKFSCKLLFIFNFSARQFVQVRFISYTIFILILSCGLFLIYEDGFANYFMISRADRALITRGSFFMSIFDSLLIGIYWLVISTFLFNKTKLSRFVFIIYFVLLCYAISTISLSTLVSITLPLIYFFRFSTFRLFIFLFLFSNIGLSLAILWKPLMSAILLTSSFSFSELQFPVELTTWVKIMMNLESTHSYFYWNQLHLGQTFLDTFYCVIRPFHDIDPLSVRYIKSFDPSVFYSGGGRGFSLPLEAYINYLFFGPLLVGYIVGLFFKLLSLNGGRSFFVFFMQVCFVGILFKFFRSESYAILKPTIWLQVIPVFCILFCYKILLLLKPICFISDYRSNR